METPLYLNTLDEPTQIGKKNNSPTTSVLHYVHIFRALSTRTTKSGSLFLFVKQCQLLK